ncbi:hypothetical protein DKX38_020366 [Salix brachista]|uniref:AAA+ ATPase domain-containing protein n=1 Tax=Salix brachista TaxID=2182728 RepID=A0A5N5K563_9ROSI|nr:hypothetical protein DKX38_020366 [Salix brachista]
MAAEFLLTFTIEETLKKVISIAAEGISFALGFEGQLERLKNSLTTIQAKLEDAAGRHVTDKSVKLWLERLQDVAYEAEDVLDENAYESLRKDQEGDLFSFDTLTLCLSMGPKVIKINEALEEILNDAAAIGLVSTSLKHEDKAQEVWRDLDRVTDSFLDYFVGREGDVSIVMEKLTSLTKQQHVLSVVPIVGMAGLGKTTLAKKVHEVVRERKHFDVTLWVCVANDFNKVKILGAMLQLFDRTTGGLDSLEAILRNLEKELENKTFFLVLDDVWNADNGKWDDLKEILSRISSKNGNAVLVTTRKTGIATMMETSPGSQYQPGKLSDGECWSIIKQKASGGGEATLAADLESIGKDIAKKCGGIPLLAKVLGGTLRGKETQDWRSILDNHMVEELGCLNELKGELKIHNLEQVRDEEEAGKAKLREKRLDRLVLEWSYRGDSSANYEGALQGLQPHPDIRSLTIKGYGGEKFPSWILAVVFLSKTTNKLVVLTIECVGGIQILKEAMKWLYEASAEQCLSGWITVRVAFCCLYENG